MIVAQKTNRWEETISFAEQASQHLSLSVYRDPSVVRENISFKVDSYRHYTITLEKVFGLN